VLVPSTDTGLDYETIPPPVDLLDLDLAMDALAQESPAIASVIEMRYPAATTLQNPSNLRLHP